MATLAAAEEVWQFWFSGDQQENYRRKWFPTTGADIQAR